MNTVLLMAIVLILIVVATVITKKVPFNFVLLIVPIVCALLLGYSVEETSTFVVEQLSSMMQSAGFMLLFAFLYLESQLTALEYTFADILDAALEAREALSLIPKAIPAPICFPTSFLNFSEGEWIPNALFAAASAATATFRAALIAAEPPAEIPLAIP